MNYGKELCFCVGFVSCIGLHAQPYMERGADEQTPSYAQYFSWINNTNEGPTDEQTAINLDFFKWLHDRY